MDELAIYIHIPFCISKCYYCDFNSYPDKGELIEKYFDSLNKEIKMYSNIAKQYTVKTIFIGGGTPSAVDGKYIYEILNSIYKNFHVVNLAENTIELNPKSVDKEKLNIYKEVGVNRISIGCQSLNDRLLKSIGRVHNSDDFYYTYDLLMEQGFTNLNVDLMFGLPNQTTRDVLSTLKDITALDVKHISFYSLIIEEGTKFYKWYNSGEIILPDEDEERNMYHKGLRYLKSKDYNHYEISNFSKEGFQCEHNLFYWKVKPYIGLGLGAHSNIQGRRYWNYGDFNNYFRCIEDGILPICGGELIDKEMEMAEYLMLGLRLVKGVSKAEFNKRFGVSVDSVYGDILKKHSDNELLYIDNNSIRFTDKGLDLANLVLVDLLPE